MAHFYVRWPVCSRCSTDGGSIVNIAPISGLRASTLQVACGTSKAAIIQLTRQQVVELGNVGFRVNTTALSALGTEMTKLVYSVAIRSDYYDTIPLNHYGLRKNCLGAGLFVQSGDKLLKRPGVGRGRTV